MSGSGRTNRWYQWLVFLVLVPGMALGLGPVWLLDSGWGGRVDRWELHAVGLLPLAAGVMLMLWCWWDFWSRGRGTPAPFAPTEYLVVTGPYRVVRNPMYVAGVTFLVGLALTTGAPGLGVYAAAFWLVTALFVRVYEEPHLRATYGTEYDDYCHAVPAWVPRWSRVATHGDPRSGR